MANMTRKSLAVVASSALAIAGLSAAPAQAASVSTVLADGSTYVGLMGEDNFNLTVSFSQDIANFNNAKVLIGNPDGLVFDVDATDINGAGDDVNVAVIAADATDVLGVGAADGRSFEVSIGNPAPDAAGEVTIQAIIDNDGDGEASAGDILGPVRTITFLDPADVTFSGTYGAVGIGDAQAAITISASDNVNITQIDPANFAVALTDNAGQDIDADDTTIALDGDDMVATIDIDADANNLTDDSANGDNGVGETAITAAGLKLVAVVTYDDGNADAVTSAQLLKTVSPAAVDAEADATEATANLKGAAGAWEARGGYTGTHTLTVGFTDGGDAVSGVAVDVTVAEAIDADTTITANGRSLEDGDDDLEYSLTTNADGEISITLSSNTGTDTDAVTVTWAVDGVTDSATVTWEDAEIDSIELVDYASGVANASAGDSISVRTVLVDTYGVQASGDYRVVFSGDADGAIVSAANGVANATLEVADPVANIVATVQKKAAADGNFYALNAGDLAAGEVEADAEAVTLTVNDADTDFAATTLGAAIDDAHIDVLGETYVVGDTRLSLFTSDYADGEANAAGDPTHAVLSVNVDDGAGAAVAATVTFSAAGLAFSEADTVYTTGSITVKTAADGTASVNVYGNVSGDYEITVSGAGLSDTVDLEILAADANTEDSVTLSVSGNEAGRTMIVSGSVVDAWGNPVAVVADDFSLTYTGPGFIVGDLPTSVGADGKIEFKVLLGSKDEIVGTVSVETAGADGEDLATDTVAQQADNVTATLDIAPVVEEVDNTKVNAGSFKGYVAVYAKGHEGKRLSAKIGNDWVVVESLASNFERIVDFTGAGYTISVRIYIDRVLVDTIVVTTK